MNVGITVAVGVVGAFALYETVLPRLYAVLRKWRREQTRAKAEKGEPSPKNDAAVRCPLSSVQVGDKVEQRTETSVQNVPDTNSRTQGVDATGESRSPADAPAPQPTTNSPDAGRLWEEARDMPHNFIPDPKTDGDYLSKIYTAARLGHLEAMVKLGDYAYRRGAVVEAFYWTLLAELKGATGLGVALREMRSRWMSEGCPAEYRNAYTDFTEEQGVFARAVLRLQCGVDPQYAHARLKELADRGVEEVRLFLGLTKLV